MNSKTSADCSISHSKWIEVRFCILTFGFFSLPLYSTVENFVMVSALWKVVRFSQIDSYRYLKARNLAWGRVLCNIFYRALCSFISLGKIEKHFVRHIICILVRKSTLLVNGLQKTFSRRVREENVNESRQFHGL